METVYIPGNYSVHAFLVVVIYHRSRKGFFRSSNMADVDRRYKMLHRPTIHKLTGGINCGKNRMTSFYCSKYSGYRQMKLKSASRCLSCAG